MRGKSVETEFGKKYDPSVTCSIAFQGAENGEVSGIEKLAKLWPKNERGKKD